MTQTSISSKLDNKYSTANQNKNKASNTDEIHSCVTPQKNYSVQATYITHRFTPLKTTLPIVPVELQKTKQLPLAGK